MSLPRPGSIWAAPALGERGVLATGPLGKSFLVNYSYVSRFHYYRDLASCTDSQSHVWRQFRMELWIVVRCRGSRSSTRAECPVSKFLTSAGARNYLQRGNRCVKICELGGSLCIEYREFRDESAYALRLSCGPGYSGAASLSYHSSPYL